MIDLFLCTAANDPLRRAMFDLCLTRWQDSEIDDLHVIRPLTIPCEPRLFQLERRKYAEANARGAYYICADDDCLLESSFSIAHCIDVLERHPDYAVLSLWPNNSTLHAWCPAPEEAATVCVGATVHEDTEVMEHVSVGGIRICRKGVMKEWPRMTGKTYDSEQCGYLRSIGYRSGYYKDVMMNHLGRGYSTVWP